MSEVQVVGFSSVSLFPAREWESVTQVETRGIDLLTRRRTQDAGIFKGLEDKIPPAHSRYIHVRQE